MSDLGSELDQPEQGTGGEIVAAFLERCGVEATFGVISIHNMPILDAISRRNRIRYVPARGEAGAVNMADANARVRGGLSVAFTSTGTAAGNASGAMVEALTAGTPMLHITGQIELPYLDRNRGYIHEARDQLDMLKSVSKAAYRVWSSETLLGTLKEAARVALTPPAGPVSVEIPIDIQEGLTAWPQDLEPAEASLPMPSPDALDALADDLAKAKRPMLWLGGGARHAGYAVLRLAEMGIGIVTSVQGRGVVPEDDPRTLGSYNLQPAVEEFYGTCDAMLVAGSRLRGNETLKYTLKLPRPLYQIDADPSAENRSYPVDRFVTGDAAIALAGLADRLDGRLKVDRKFAKDLAAAREKAEADLRETLGPYNDVLDAVMASAPPDVVWVRDITLSNSTWGNRLPALVDPRSGVHALGGGIGQGLPMGVGAALAAGDRKTLILAGDGGFQVTSGELATLAEEKPDAVILLMNDQGYGVIRNIQDHKFESRQVYSHILTPKFDALCASVGIPHVVVTDPADLKGALDEAFALEGPAMVEVDMTAVGPFARPFAGPPVRK